MSSRQSVLMRPTPKSLKTYLDGRPRDPRVRYTTHVNKGKDYRKPKKVKS